MKFFRGFKYAFKGIIYAINHERNMRIHIVVTVYLLYFLSYYRISDMKMAVVLLVTALVLSLELVNTAVERVCNLYTTNKNRLIGIAKDVSAGAVLVAAVFAVAIAFFILWEPDTIWKIIVFHCTSPERLTLLILTVIISILFIIIGPKGMFKNAKSYFVKKKDMNND